MKNKLTMKKILIPLLTAFVVPSALFSCGHDVALDSPINDTSETTEASETTETTVSETEEVTTEAPTENQSDFDFAKTVESTYICGQKLSYPITWGQFGEDFSIDSENAYCNSEKELVMAHIKYKGTELGVFTFKGCGDTESISETTPVIRLDYINSKDLDLFDKPKITVSDIALLSTFNQMTETFGENYSNDLYRQYVYENNDGNFKFLFSIDEDEIYGISIQCKSK